MRGTRSLGGALALTLALGGCSLVIDGQLEDLPSRDGGGVVDGGTDAGVDGASDATVDAPVCVPSEELCDGVDNDCDGEPDNDVVDCTFANASGVCADAVCSQGACDEGFLDCAADDGCETPESWSDCGGCATACAWNQGCSASTCAEPSLQLLGTMTNATVVDLATGGGYLYALVYAYSSSCADDFATVAGVGLRRRTSRTACYDAVLVQYEVATGNLGWVRQMWVPDGRVSPVAVEADGDGNAFVMVSYTSTGNGGSMDDDPASATQVGTSFQTSSSTDGLVVRIGTDGAMDWRRILAGTGDVNSDGNLALDSTGAVYAVGRASGVLYGPLGALLQTGERGMYLVKLDNADGSYRTANALVSASLYEFYLDFGSDDRLWLGMRLDGDVDFGEPFGSFTSNFHQLIVEVDPSSLDFESVTLQDGGACPAEEYYQGLGANSDNALVSLTGCDGVDAVYFAGTADEISLPTGPHVIVYDESQNPVKAALWGSRTDIGDARSLSVDDTGYFVSGRGFSEDDYGGGPLPTLTTPLAYLSRYDLEGNFAWSTLIESASYGRGAEVVSDGAGGAFWAVSIRGTATIGEDEFTPVNINGDYAIVHVETP